MRFKLKFVFIALTGICLLFGICNQYCWKEQRTVKAIENAGGRVWYQHEVNDEPYVAGQSDGAWRQRLFGKQAISPAVIVEFLSAARKGEDKKHDRRIAQLGTLQAISKLQTVKALRFYDIKVRLDQLYILQDLTNLAVLQFSCASSATTIELDNLACLSKLPCLKTLSITGMPNTDGKLEFIAGMTGLSSLHLEATKIDSSDIQSISKLFNLEELVLRSLETNPSGLLSLPALDNLVLLDLGPTRLQTSDLVFLKKFQRLQSLSLSLVEIDDDFIDLLQSLESFQHLELYGGNIDAKALSHIRESFPDCTVNIVP